MIPKPGRNDPCPCGSGKKYKKCHLIADEAHAYPQAATRLHSPASFAEQVQMFDDQLAAGELDEDRAFDMLDTLHARAIELGERAAFRRLVERLHQAAPDAYRPHRIWCISWLIEDAVAERRHDLLPELADRLADAALDSPDETFRLIDLLLFHGQTESLVELMTRLWPAVVSSRDLLPSVIGEFSGTLMMLLILRHLERGGTPSYDDPALRADLEPLNRWEPLVETRMRRLVAALAGDGPTWALADFSRHGRSEEDLWENLLLLGADWCGWLYRERGVPIARAELVRMTYTDYLVEVPAGRHGQVNLLPSGRTIERHLAALASFLSGQYYKAGALYALLPAFADFLVLRGLLTPEKSARVCRDLRRMRDQMVRIVTEATHDPLLIEAVRQVGE